MLQAKPKKAKKKKEKKKKKKGRKKRKEGRKEEKERKKMQSNGLILLWPRPPSQPPERPYLGKMC